MPRQAQNPKKLPASEKLREMFRYDARTGSLTWRVSNSNRVRVGDEAGTLRPDGYVAVNIDGVPRLAHRIVWCMVYGSIPADALIDHDNRVRHDNRLDNLFLVTYTGNAKNSRKRKRTALPTGVDWYARTGKWRAHIGVNKRQVHLGYFSDLDDAVTARHAAEEEYGFHEEHGR